MPLPITVTFRPKEQTHRVSRSVQHLSPKPHALRCRFEAEFRPWPITIHQCPPSGEIAMSHKNENLAATEQVCLDAFLLWCTQIHTCFQPFPAPAPLWSSAGWGSDTGNDACRNLLGRSFHHFNRRIWITSKVTSPLYFWPNIQAPLSLQMIHTLYYFILIIWTCLTHVFTVLSLEPMQSSQVISHANHKAPLLQTHGSLRGDRAWFPGVRYKSLPGCWAFPLTCQVTSRMVLLPLVIMSMSVDPNLDFQRYKRLSDNNKLIWMIAGPSQNTKPRHN